MVLYHRLPYSIKHPVTVRTFITEFTAYLETTIMSAQPSMIIGDFNIHVDDPNDLYAVEFHKMLESLGLLDLLMSKITFLTW